VLQWGRPCRRENISRAGYETFATARDIAGLGDLRAIGCRTLALDVTDEAARQSAVETIEREFGAVGVLVNNAGYGQYGPLEEISLDLVRRQFETNVFGGLRLSQLVLPAMRRKHRGRIVNVSSVAGRVSSIGGGAYHATKFAIEALTDALRPEVEPFGIDVVNVLPGPIATRFETKLLRSIPDTGPQSPMLISSNASPNACIISRSERFRGHVCRDRRPRCFKADGDTATHTLQRRLHRASRPSRPRADARSHRGRHDPAEDPVKE
jgi:NAD(P)-dependent dehydrogenase (short-subunit alcohol dehydrogenase family)